VKPLPTNENEKLQLLAAMLPEKVAQICRCRGVYFEIERFAFSGLTRQQVVSTTAAASVHSSAWRIVVQAWIVGVFEADRLKFDGTTGRFGCQRRFCL